MTFVGVIEDKSLAGTVFVSKHFADQSHVDKGAGGVALIAVDKTCMRRIRRDCNEPSLCKD